MRVKSNLLFKPPDGYRILAEDKLFRDLDPPPTCNLESEERTADHVDGYRRFYPKAPSSSLIEALQEHPGGRPGTVTSSCMWWTVSNPNMDMQMHVVMRTLRELKVEGQDHCHRV